MSPEAQRIAIAEACGWKLTQTGGVNDWHNPEGKWMGGAISPHVNFPGVPDYLTDLDACHEMEKVLTKLGKWDKYCSLLLDDSDEDNARWFVLGDQGWLVHASAAAKCECFLKAIDLWLK